MKRSAQDEAFRFQQPVRRLIDRDAFTIIQLKYLLFLKKRTYRPLGYRQALDLKIFN
jgi:hypothetical protein